VRSVVLDYNGFFAACEQQERPELRGRPVAVAPIASEATSCIASSYDARRKGIKVGTPVHEARRLCPGIVILESRPEVYIRYHEKLIEAVSTCLPVSEVLSIDELWCELPPSWRERDKAICGGARDQARHQATRRGVPDLQCRHRSQSVAGENRVRPTKTRWSGGD
jgi:DNA polymerase-4